MDPLNEQSVPVSFSIRFGRPSFLYSALIIMCVFKCSNNFPLFICVCASVAFVDDFYSVVSIEAFVFKYFSLSIACISCFFGWFLQPIEYSSIQEWKFHRIKSLSCHYSIENIYTDVLDIVDMIKFMFC